MYDIKISDDGSIDLTDGDTQPVNYSVFIAQKIYRALMNMPMGVITGTDETKPDTASLSMMGYLTDRFTYDADVEPAGFSVEIVTRGSQRVSFSLNYDGTSPEGEIVNLANGYLYDIDAGTIRSVDFEPSWLETRESPYEEELTIGVTVETPATEIEIPIEPLRRTYPLEYDYDYTTEDTYGNLLPEVDEGVTADEAAAEVDIVGAENEVGGDVLLDTDDETRLADTVVVLCEEGKEGLSSDVEEVEFTIETDDRLIYPIGRYVTGYVEGDQVLLGATVTSVPENMIFSRTSEYGEEVIIVHEGSGTITGTAYMVTAKYATRAYKVDRVMSRNHVFKLRPVRGKFYAIFDKTVKSGDYVLKYKAYKEDRN
jgi:hypothetical protein